MGNWSQQKFDSDWTVVEFVECRLGKSALEVEFSSAQALQVIPVLNGKLLHEDGCE